MAMRNTVRHHVAVWRTFINVKPSGTYSKNEA